MEKVDDVANPEFKWLKKRRCGGKKKEVSFYESFIYDGVEYTLYDCVYMYKKGLREPYIGKLVKAWENSGKNDKRVKKSDKWVKVQWFFRPQEISKWLRDTKILENEILLASGEGLGLANVNPLEAIVGRCNVVCVSKDCRNPQPSNEEIKAADYIFYRTFDVESCGISDKMDDKVGGLEIKYIFNRKVGENISTSPEGTSDRKEENQNTTTCGESQQLLTKSPSNRLKDDTGDKKLAVKVDAKGESEVQGVPNLFAETSLAAGEPSFGSWLGLNKVDKTNSEMGKTDGCIVKADKDSMKLRDMPSNKDNKAGKDAMDAGIVPVRKVEAKERNKTPMEFDNLHDQPSKRIKSNGNTTPKDKQVEIARDSDRLKDMPSSKSKVANSVKVPVDSKSKLEEKLPLHVNNLKALGTPGTSKDKPNQKNGKVLLGSEKGMISAKVTSDSEGKILKKARAESSFKVPDNTKKESVQKLRINNNGRNGKDLVVTSALPEEKPKSVLALDSLGTSKEPKREQSDESKRKLSTSRSPKVSCSSADEDKKTMYQEFMVGPKPQSDRSSWFKQLPWEQRLKEAYDQGTAVMLHNLDPDYTSREVEDIIWHALTENCEAKTLQRTAASSPYQGQALILFKTKEAALRVLTKLDEECLRLPNGRPLVATACPPISSKKNSKFFGHLAIDKIKLQNQREMSDAVSTSHYSQPNSIDYDMAMEWFLLRSRSDKWWKKMHEQQGDELNKLEATLKGT